MADNENKTHCLMQDCIISQFGKCNAGTMLSESDVDSSTWSWLQQNNFLKSVADIEQEADSDAQPNDEQTDEQADVQTDAQANDEQEVESSANDETPDSNNEAPDLLARVKALLAAENNMQKSKIAQALDCEQSALDDVLTEANGIEKKAGWYSLIEDIKPE